MGNLLVATISTRHLIAAALENSVQKCAVFLGSGNFQ
jgi:hypothetical protein